MSIAKRVTQAFERMLECDPESALFQICAAIEETSRREGRAKGRRGYKAFLTANVPIICGVGLGVPISGLRLGFRHPDLPETEDGTAAIEDIVYHVCRCGLYHAASLPDSVRFTDNQIGSDSDGHLLLPLMFVNGLILAVVASPANAKEKTMSGYYVSVNGERFDLNESWGKRVDLTTRLKEMARRTEALRRHQTVNMGAER